MAIVDGVDLDAVAGELYALEPSEFTAARTEHEKQAKAAGDKNLVKQIHQLRKPTVTAWLSNLLARESPDSLAPLKELGEQLRQAQQTLQGDELRALSRQRQRLVYALVTEARRLAQSRGQKVTETVARELEQTLEATLADPTVADTVVAGRLTTAVQHAGFGVGGVLAGPARNAADRDAPVAPIRRITPSRPAAGETPEDIAARKKATARANAERDVADAEEALAQADRAFREATAAADDVERRQSGLTERIASLEEELAAAEEQLPVIRREARQAGRERNKAEQVTSRAERMVGKARANRDELD
ncbi:MAG: hypothetical protein H0T66_09615 [Geodermatophilaceae bacterium]|nr:hypothetical protein [Geodermatophilaceae bacterium]